MRNAALHNSTSGEKENARVATPYGVIHTLQVREKVEERIATLPKTTQYIHIDGPPYLWVVEKAIVTFVGLRSMRITPTMERFFGPRHKELIEKHGLLFELGYFRPELVWKNTDIRRRVNPKRSQWIQNLSLSQQRLFQELLALNGVDDARIVNRYFCVNGEPYMTTQEVGKLFGYSHTCASSVVSTKIAAVHKLLDDSIKVPACVCNHAKFLRQKIEAARTAKEKHESERVLLDSFGIESLPSGLPPTHVVTYCLLHQLFWQGELHGRLAWFARELRTLVLRYGLKGGGFRTYESVGRGLGLSRQLVQQAEARAFRILGIRTYRS